VVQLHSSPFAEVAAHVCGLAAGIAAYAASGIVTHDHKIRIRVGIVASVMVNAIIGGKINLVMRDFVSLIVVRPISAFLGAKLLEYATKAMGW
jgi:hypothetical protein